MFLISFSAYFLIAYFIESIPCPKWISNIDKIFTFIWWMIIPYYLLYNTTIATCIDKGYF